MIHVKVTHPVNDPARPDQYTLTREELWEGLLGKAEDAVPFVPGMSECTVLERRADGLVREVVVLGERVREDVTFHEERRVSFRREDDRATWLIHNDIGEDESGGLTLTFISDIRFHDQAAGADQDGEATERMRAGTSEVVQNTLDTIRRMAAARATGHTA